MLMSKDIPLGSNLKNYIYIFLYIMVFSENNLRLHFKKKNLSHQFESSLQLIAVSRHSLQTL
jgi:hypothetical protein